MLRCSYVIWSPFIGRTLVGITNTQRHSQHTHTQCKELIPIILKSIWTESYSAHDELRHLEQTLMAQMFEICQLLYGKWWRANEINMRAPEKLFSCCARESIRYAEQQEWATALHHLWNTFMCAMVSINLSVPDQT